MKRRYAIFGGLLVTGLVPALPAHAAQVQVDISSAFNADVIVNSENGIVDSSQSPSDNASYSLATQGGLEDGCGAGYKGLPNDGKFESNADHPDIRLAYRNSNSGQNARRSEVGDKFSFTVPKDKYKRIHYIAMSGDGASEVKLTLTYGDGSTDVKEFTVGDWFQPPASNTYELIKKMNRMTPSASECEDFPDAGRVFGKSLGVDKDKKLKKITIKKLSSAEYSILNTLGVTAVKA
jgi:hypothetical protein